MALDQAGAAAGGATVYTTLEPCAHESTRGPACTDLLIAARPARIVAAMADPDSRTAGQGFARLRAAGIGVTGGVGTGNAERAMAGFLTRQRLGRPHVTLKLATSLDGRIALPDGRSRWITGDAARRHAHLERARVEAIIVGRGTFEADAPSLDVRLPGLEERSPVRLILSSSTPSSRRKPGSTEAVSPQLSGTPSTFRNMDPSFRRADGEEDWTILPNPQAIANLPAVDHILVEGGAGTAAAFLRADLVDRLLLYRAPILIGEGLPAIRDIGLGDLSDAHGRWRFDDARMLGSDRLEVYERVRG